MIFCLFFLSILGLEVNQCPANLILLDLFCLHGESEGIRLSGAPPSVQRETAAGPGEVGSLVRGFAPTLTPASLILFLRALLTRLARFVATSYISFLDADAGVCRWIDGKLLLLDTRNVSNLLI